MYGRRKFTDVSEDGHVQEGKRVVVFQFVRKLDVGVFCREIFCKFNDVIVRSDEEGSRPHGSKTGPDDCSPISRISVVES